MLWSRLSLGRSRTGEGAASDVSETAEDAAVVALVVECVEDAALMT